ncbi:MAG: hydroxysqualene dehydroxylase HpnE [Bacteroidetes bacterium]|nr:hydroxysqualene dehydroxylase HpnE [Bacteroidota bacterium]
MKSVCVIGGGVAGLSAAVFLANKKFKVTLLEKNNKLGGRACSYYDKTLECSFDNGQHLLIGGYKSTISFFEIIGAKSNFHFQPQLRIPFLTQEQKKVIFKLPKSNSQFLAVLSFIKLTTLSFIDRIKILQLLLRMKQYNSDDYKELSVTEFLKRNKQSTESQNKFWNTISISTLNCSPTEASAKIFIDVLKIVFLSERQNSVLVIPQLDLSSSYITNSLEYLNNNGCEYFLGEGLLKLNTSDSKIDSILTTNNRNLKFDYYILAVDWRECESLLRKSSIDIEEFGLRSSPILSVHLWTDKKFMDEEFYSLVESPIQWVFRKQNFISIVISDPGELIEKSKEEILKLCDHELKKYFKSYNNVRIKDFRIVKEKNATFIPDSRSFNLRPSQKTNIENLFLTGDWTMTGLPSTIESSVYSSLECAELIEQKEKLSS